MWQGIGLAVFIGLPKLPNGWMAGTIFATAHHYPSSKGRASCLFCSGWALAFWGNLTDDPRGFWFYTAQLR
jgi:hypothetical protein